MKLLLLEETEFRGKVIKAKRKADIPDGVAFKLIANGQAKKITNEEFEAFDVNEALDIEDLNVLKVDELKELCKHLELPTSGKKDDLVALIEEKLSSVNYILPSLEDMDLIELIEYAKEVGIDFSPDLDEDQMRELLRENPVKGG